MKRAILAALAALLLLATPVFGVTILKEDNQAPTIVGDASWGETIAYDFKDRNGQLVVRHVCWEIYAFYPDGSRLGGPILQDELLAVGETVTLDAWPSTSWGSCAAQLWKPAANGHPGIGHSDLWYLVPPQ